jgi:hypothetical protein
MTGSDDFRWAIWLSVLSLDATSPFHADMVVPVSKSFCTGDLRPLIRAHRASVEGLAFPSIAPLIEAVLKEIGEREGLRQKHAFEAWRSGIATFSMGERRYWALWSVVLRDWGFGPQPQRFANQKWFSEVMTHFMELMDFNRLRSRAEAARRGPLTDWDVEMFSRHRFYETDDGTDFDPFLPVLNTIEFVRLRKFHSQCLPLLNDARADDFDLAARETAIRIGYPLDNRFVSFRRLDAPRGAELPH